jgi:hypothetical protein
VERGCHTLNLGGGLGAREDSLYTFKIRLSKTATTFHTFRAILWPGIYRKLGREVAEASNYFPSYRGPSKTPRT